MLVRFARRALGPAAFVAAYFVAGDFGLTLAYAHPTISPLWAPAGIALAAFLLAGYRIWPAVLCASLLTHATTAGSWLSAALIAGIETGQVALAALLVNRFAGGIDVFRHPTNVIRFATGIAPGVAVLGASMAVAWLSLSGGLVWPPGRDVWLSWWLGQLTGMLVVTPLVVLWATGRRRRTRLQHVEFIVLLGLLVPACLAVFAGLSPFEHRDYPLSILCVPFLMWASFRLGRREAATVVAVLTAVAAFGTFLGVGPYARGTPLESYVLLQLNVGIWATMTMSLAAAVAEHLHAERLAKTLATTDPLTGLSNYRQLSHEIHDEITRSLRTGRPFALVFVDVNGLKQINDTLGHLAGNQALRRVAAVLRRACRAMDRPARFGGDEFVIVLPETDSMGAHIVASRIAAAVSADTTAPALSVATGAAEYPRDGTTVSELLSRADRALYQSKTRARAADRPAVSA
jgi:diguanylate cyclase (GGDEF)-like protein